MPVAHFSRRALLATLLATSLAGSAFAQVSDPLPSWNEGATKKSITDFVARETAQGSPDFVAPELRIATFDNDGTVWCEQQFSFQLAFAFDRVKVLAPQPRVKDEAVQVLKGLAA